MGHLNALYPCRIHHRFRIMITDESLVPADHRQSEEGKFSRWGEPSEQYRVHCTPSQVTILPETPQVPARGGRLSQTTSFFLGPLDKPSFVSSMVVKKLDDT
jgi:hypothetical protein